MDFERLNHGTGNYQLQIEFPRERKTLQYCRQWIIVCIARIIQMPMWHGNVRLYDYTTRTYGRGVGQAPVIDCGIHVAEPGGFGVDLGPLNPLCV